MAGRRDPWYAAGLRFTCTQCGDCCTGDPGYVWVSLSEREQIAGFLEIPLERFEQEYVRRVGDRQSLREWPDGDCVFFDNPTRACTVYPVRPVQCRTWPFWERNLRSPESWSRACAICPGSGKGRLYQVEEILSLLDSDGECA